MRLSEAIAIGRMLVEPRRADIRGCAIGMAIAAIGEEPNYSVIPKRWPWALRKLGAAPCGCDPSSTYIQSILAHLFDHHVMGVKDWTLDQLIDWIRSVEPAEDAPNSDEALATSEAHAEVCEKSS